MKKPILLLLLAITFLLAYKHTEASMQSSNDINTMSLYDAVEKADLAAVKKLIDKKTINDFLEVPLYSGHKHGWYADGTPVTSETISKGQGTLLHLAVFYSNKLKMSDIIKFLLESGADPNIKDQDGRIPLQMGVNQGISEQQHISESIERILIENGSDVNFNNEELHHMSLLRRYIIQNNFEMAKLVIEYGADLKGRSGAYALYSAAYADSHIFIKLLFEKGVDPNIPLDYPYPLCIAAESSKNALSKVKLFIEYGADINAEGMPNPLWCAISGGNSDALKYLAEHGANLNPNSNRPAEKAVELDRIEDLKYLIEHGAEVSPKTFGQPLEKARSLEIVKYLVEKGADLKGRSAAKLMETSINTGRNDIVLYLQSKGVADRP